VNAPRALTLGLAAGCAVVPLPEAVAFQGPTAKDPEWDAWGCAREMAHRNGYNPVDSPAATIFRGVFVFGTAGAAVGGLVTGIPASAAGPATDGRIAGAANGRRGRPHQQSGRTGALRARLGRLCGAPRLPGRAAGARRRLPLLFRRGGRMQGERKTSEALWPSA
jgi:hypothetical protein